MTRIGHVLDSTFAWDQRVALRQLLDRLPSDRVSQFVCTVDEQAASMSRALGEPVHPLGCIGRWKELSAPTLRRFSERHQLDLLHAWGPRGAAGAVATSIPVLVDMADPALANTCAKRIRTLCESGRVAVCCRAQLIRRRLVENGVPLDRTAVIRPGVDFAAVNQIRRGPIRDALGLARSDFLIVTPERVQRDDGHLDACIVASMLNRVGGGVKLILPGNSKEKRRLERFIAALPAPPTLVSGPTEIPTEQLVAVADALVIVPRGDIATASIAWAMASETLVVGTATYAVAELIASGVNGLLFKQTPGRRMVADIAPRLRDRSAHAKLKEAARGQAYEVFGLRRSVEQTMQLYDNLRAGEPADAGINDPAMVG